MYDCVQSAWNNVVHACHVQYGTLKYCVSSVLYVYNPSF